MKNYFNAKTEPNDISKDAKLRSTTIDHYQTMNKYDINQTIKGQAVGGPKKKPNMTMWDMITLYDTNKKKVEDEEAFNAHKQ